jgi:hypothetical protein
MNKLKAPTKEELEHAYKIGKLEAGLLGNFFGKGEESKSRIVGFLCILLISVGIVFTFLNLDKALEFWKLTIPAITLCMGYLLGKK